MCKLCINQNLSFEGVCQYVRAKYRNVTKDGTKQYDTVEVRLPFLAAFSKFGPYILYILLHFVSLSQRDALEEYFLEAIEKLVTRNNIHYSCMQWSPSIQTLMVSSFQRFFLKDPTVLTVVCVNAALNGTQYTRVFW